MGIWFFTSVRNAVLLAQLEQINQPQNPESSLEVDSLLACVHYLPKMLAVVV